MSQHLHNKVFGIVSEVAHDMHIECYVVGGYVRDAYMGNADSKDIDFVCDRDPISLARSVAQRLPSDAHVSIYKTFGTVMIAFEGIQLEFVGARKESYTLHSRKPEVQHGTLDEDRLRRDFTINTMSISLCKEDYGQLVDPLGGVRDIEQKIIRTPLDPNQTYIDDPLRMLRAVRFACKLGFRIEQTSLEAIIRNKEYIKDLSQERISEEINKIMMSATPSVGWKLLSDTQTLPHILPELELLKGVTEVQIETHNHRHKENFFHTLQVLDNVALRSNNLWLRWAALLHDIGKYDTKRFDPNIGWTFHRHEYIGAKKIPHIFRRLKLPVQKMKYVKKLVSMSSRPSAVTIDATDSAVRRLVFEAGDDMDDLIILCESDMTTQNQARRQRYLSNYARLWKRVEEIEEKDHVRNWQPPLSGTEIMDMLSLTPGREVGVLKDMLKEAILDGDVKNEKQAATDYVYTKAATLGIGAAQSKKTTLEDPNA